MADYAGCKLRGRVVGWLEKHATCAQGSVALVGDVAEPGNAHPLVGRAVVHQGHRSPATKSAQNEPGVNPDLHA